MSTLTSSPGRGWGADEAERTILGLWEYCPFMEQIRIHHRNRGIVPYHLLARMQDMSRLRDLDIWSDNLYIRENDPVPPGAEPMFPLLRRLVMTHHEYAFPVSSP